MLIPSSSSAAAAVSEYYSPSDLRTVLWAISLNLTRSSLQVLAASTLAALSSFGSAHQRLVSPLMQLEKLTTLKILMQTLKSYISAGHSFTAISLLEMSTKTTGNSTLDTQHKIPSNFLNFSSCPFFLICCFTCTLQSKSVAVLRWGQGASCPGPPNFWTQ